MKTLLDKIRIEATARLAYKLTTEKRDVVKMGKDLIQFLDPITSGFWIWDISGNIEYYSPEFIKSLGFENEVDFPYVPDSWQKQIFKEDAKTSLENFNSHLKDANYPYLQVVRYQKKNSKTVRLLCAGTIVNRNNPDHLIMIGVHEIIP